MPVILTPTIYAKTPITGFYQSLDGITWVAATQVFSEGDITNNTYYVNGNAIEFSKYDTEFSPQVYPYLKILPQTSYTDWVTVVAGDTHWAGGTTIADYCAYYGLSLTSSSSAYQELRFITSYELRNCYGAGWRRNQGYTNLYYRNGGTVGIFPPLTFSDALAELQLDCVVKPDDTVGVYPTLINDTDSPDWVTEQMALVWYCVREFCLTQLIGIEGSQQKAAYADAEYKRLVKQMLGKLVL